MSTRRWYPAVSVAMSLALVWFASVPVAASAPTDMEVAHAAAFRERMGFPHGEGFVRQTFTDDDYSSTDWGTPLSASESRDLEQRARLRPQLQDAIDYAERQPGSGGVYLDQAAGGMPVFQFTEGVEDHRAAIERRLPTGTEYALRKVDFTEGELEVTKEKVSNDMETLAGSGLPVIQVAVSNHANRVMVGLSEAVPGALDVLQERYGRKVAVEVIGETELDDCPDRAHCKPLKGGIKITRPPTNGYCTSAFLARRDNGVMVLLTAGHCIVVLGGSSDCTPIWRHNDYWDENTDRIGCAKGESLGSPGSTVDGDVGWINVDEAEDVNPHNEFYRAQDPKIADITSRVFAAGLTEGDTLCRSGAGPSPRNGRPAWDCGELINKCAAKWTADSGVSPRWKISCAGVVAFDSVGGDSGAPYVRRMTDTEYAAVGIHSHSSTMQECDLDPSQCKSWFTRMNVVEQPLSGLEFRVCTTAGC